MNFMIACHGRLASGVLSTLSLFIGADEAAKIQTIDAYVDDSDYTPTLQAFIDGVADDDFGIIFTDMEFGSVNQKVLQMNQKSNVVAITGFNVSLLMELIMSKPTDLDEIKAVIERAREEMKLSVLNMVDDSNSEDDFFG